MNAPADRIVILPRDVAARVLSEAVARGTWAIALITLAASLIILIDVFVDRGLAGQMMWPIVCVLAMASLVVFCGLRPSQWARLAYLVLGAVLATGYTVSVLAADPSLNDSAPYLANRLSFVVVLIAVSGVSTLVGVAWITAAFVMSLAATFLASQVLGFAVNPGVGPFVALIIALTSFVAVTVETRSRAWAVPDLARLEAETRRLALESQFEQRAAAIVHDTVLGDLAAVMNSTGAVDERMRARFRADVATLADPSWLSDLSSFEPSVPIDGELRIALSSLAMEFQWRGLSVKTSGNYDSVVGISSSAAASLVAVIRACLENVVNHAQCDSADLVFDSSPSNLTAMVVDSGVGFDPGAVSQDRLGIRQSIVGRIEQHGGSVKVWSSPGHGTSVVIMIPAGVEARSRDV